MIAQIVATVLLSVLIIGFAILTDSAIHYPVLNEEEDKA